MLTSLAIKWITTMSIRDRHEKLNVANEEYWQGKNREKALISEISTADHEIGRLERRIKAAEHRMAKMTKQQGALLQDASTQAAIEAGRSGSPRKFAKNAKATPRRHQASPRHPAPAAEEVVVTVDFTSTPTVTLSHLPPFRNLHHCLKHHPSRYHSSSSWK